MESDIQLTMRKGGCAGTDANAGHDGGGTVREISGTPRRGQVTRLDAYREAIRFLEEAVDALDQAHSCLKDCRCDNIVSDAYHRLSPRQLVALAEGMLKDARTVECDDCGKPLAECGCAWLRESIRGRA